MLTLGQRACRGFSGFSIDREKPGKTQARCYLAKCFVRSCCIAGMFDRQAVPWHEKHMRQMLAMLRHRGPDEFESCSMARPALEARLSIIDSPAVEPSPLPTGWLALDRSSTANLQLLELRGNAGGGHRASFQRTSDTEGNPASFPRNTALLA